MTSGSRLCMPSSLSLAIHSKIQANYYHLLTPKITNLYGSIWLFGFISCGISWWANKVCFALPYPFLLFLWNTCAHSTTTMAYINKKHFIVGPNSYIFNWFIPSFLYLHVIFFTSFNFGTRKCSSWFFFSQSRLILCCFRIVHLLWPQSDSVFALSASSKCNFNKREEKKRVSWKD